MTSVATMRHILRLRRLYYGPLIVAIIAAGLAVRANARHLPELIALYAPDTLWAFLVFALIVFIAPHLKTGQVAIVVLCFAFCIEFSQLYQTPWLNSLRETRVGGLVLGFGFLWSDLVCYTTGIMIGAMADYMLCSLLLNRKVDSNG